MTTVTTTSALHARLRQVGEILLPDTDQQASSTGDLLEDLVRSIQAEPTPAAMWLLLSAVSTVYPEPELVREALREVRLRPADIAACWLLDHLLTTTRIAGEPGRGIRIVRNAVLAEVDFSARNNLHTGIQRTVREVMPRWLRDHGVTAVVWTERSGSFRELTATEYHRIYEWRGPVPDSPEAAEDVLLIPWQSTILLLEVPTGKVSRRLAAVAELSNNAVGLIGYDLIPVVSADLAPSAADAFCRYLEIVKHSDCVAGISSSATAEFAGFAQMLPAQGLSGPAVVRCTLPMEAIGRTFDSSEETPPGTDERPPLVLSVGSFEHRKNRAALLHACELLWREGIQFRVLLIGGAGNATAVRRRAKVLARAGHELTIATAVSEEALAAAYREARFTVFPSLHEGYGLPVVESLSYGTPVITSNYGSTKEIGDEGGVLQVDPRSEVEIADAMRRLLVGVDELASLTQEIAQRRVTTWDTYAEQLWDCLVPSIDATTSEPR